MPVKTFKECLKDDLDTFINEKEFAVAVSYNSPANGVVGLAISGIFTDEFEQAAPETDMQVQSIAPVVRVKTCEIPNEKVRPGDWVTIESVEYIIKEDQPDGTGITDLILKVK